MRRGIVRLNHISHRMGDSFMNIIKKNSIKELKRILKKRGFDRKVCDDIVMFLPRGQRDFFKSFNSEDVEYAASQILMYSSFSNEQSLTEFSKVLELSIMAVYFKTRLDFEYQDNDYTLPSVAKLYYGTCCNDSVIGLIYSISLDKKKRVEVITEHYQEANCFYRYSKASLYAFKPEILNSIFDAMEEKNYNDKKIIYTDFNYFENLRNCTFIPNEEYLNTIFDFLLIENDLKSPHKKMIADEIVKVVQNDKKELGFMLLCASHYNETFMNYFENIPHENKDKFLLVLRDLDDLLIDRDESTYPVIFKNFSNPSFFELPSEYRRTIFYTIPLKIKDEEIGKYNNILEFLIRFSQDVDRPSLEISIECLTKDNGFNVMKERQAVIETAINGMESLTRPYSAVYLDLMESGIENEKSEKKVTAPKK